MRRILLGASLLATVVASPALAQKPGVVELGAFGRWNFWDNSGGTAAGFTEPRPAYGLTNTGGVGGRLGIFFLKNLSLEVSGAYAETKRKDAIIGDDTTVVFPAQQGIHNWLLRGGLTYFAPLNQSLSLAIGGHYARNIWGGTEDADEDMAGGSLGLRWNVAEKVALRLEGTADYGWSPYVERPNYAVSSVLNFGAQAGASVLIGNTWDSDGDGVRDKGDLCPNTPKGESVDANGCSESQKDDDNDGVKNNADRCPSTPAGEAVDSDGCSESQKDADGDRVPNSRDRCPNTPAGEAVDANGCSESQKDDDRDGVNNRADRCPNTPAGEKVDAAGCSDSQKDDDRDGVANSRDKCPNTPAGRQVDAEGCPVPEVRVIPREGLVLEGVTFASGSARLSTNARTILKKVAESLRENPEVQFEVQGHTDNTGSKATNTRLSQARAKAVLDYFVSQGVSESRMTAKGYGPDQPLADNSTREGRERNRRVVLVQTN